LLKLNVFFQGINVPISVQPTVVAASHLNSNPKIEPPNISAPPDSAQVSSPSRGSDHPPGPSLLKTLLSKSAGNPPLGQLPTPASGFAFPPGKNWTGFIKFI
jgi:hypothetical protein